MVISIGVVLLLAVGCSNPTSDHYPTLADARAGKLFERGWLPDILPPSAHAIRVVNNLDTNISFGSFDFSENEAEAFFGRLVAGAPEDSPYVRWPDITRDYAERGYSDWSYQQGEYVWGFFCTLHRDHCQYLLWTRREERAKPQGGQP
jgi:hypothetical protein